MRIAIAGFGVGGGALAVTLAGEVRSGHAWLGPARDIGLPIVGSIRPLPAFMEHVLAGGG